MFRKLRIHLTLFFSFITGLILVSMSFICLFVSENGMEKNDYTSFLNNVNTAVSYIESQNVLTRQWLLETEQNYHLSLQIQDNNRDLFYYKQNKSQKQKELFRQAAAKAKDSCGLDIYNENMRSSRIQQVDFQIKDSQKASYYVSVSVIPKEHGMLSLIALYPADRLKQQIWNQRLWFAGADLLGILFLFLFSWVFTKKLLLPLEKNKQKQTAFIAAASHELRSPLTVILSSLSALKKTDQRERQLSFLSSIEQEGFRMSRLIEDMLSLANADNHSWSMKWSETEIDTLLLDTYEKYEPLMREHRLHFSLVLPDGILPLCRLDPARISQVLSILLDNALSYVPAGGQVQISLSYREPWYTILVSDDGPGIPSDQREAVFQRFYRADPSHQDKSHFGLGLCIAMEIIQLHRGKLTLQDSPLGGVSFQIMLSSQPKK